ncbi:helix-turn-helix domain-containing protein [Thermincola potens]|uniref:Transcriptional regulator, XRE family n=1 Tax=Thermincola potens (strain JR) TaxID=635013 RepID=D5XF99_THEPJ|nr:helix-turn-helix transcriptional regulator [Thermincola potens]ADG82320.1 transcriptional regulator, XRE family [Thermincola potens JR]
MELFEYRKLIGENLNTYISLKGYSKSSFAKLTNISRPTLYQILSGDSPNPSTYQKQILRITEALGLPPDYFLTPPVIPNEKWRTTMIQYSDRAPTAERKPQVKELLDDLDELMSLAALYL